ncbi:uncharacterized protein LOC124160517 [Ischnura elegans]|uniref:uncharacterized protein LOC124160517 n=1 Tax=Ischnura elegans TaxID=197161 RepID=UPI001ED8AB6E|nr:uncharacterized protein LOC124160517 [Ischnura elegans]
MKKRSLAGNVAVGVFVIVLIFTTVAFCSPSWLVSDSRITGAKLERLGLWTHCFRSLGDPIDEHQRRFFVGCRWVYDPFTHGYDEIRGYLLPPFMIATQFFYTISFLFVLIAFIQVLLFFLCCGPDQGKYALLISLIGYCLIVAGISGGIAVIIFASLANGKGWMPDHQNTFLDWSFGMAVVGSFAAVIDAILFLTEAKIQKKKNANIKDSQAQFSMEESKA